MLSSLSSTMVLVLSCNARFCRCSPLDQTSDQKKKPTQPKSIPVIVVILRMFYFQMKAKLTTTSRDNALYPTFLCFFLFLNKVDTFSMKFDTFECFIYIICAQSTFFWAEICDQHKYGTVVFAYSGTPFSQI